MASGQAFGTLVLKSALQLGSAAKNYAAYQVEALAGGNQEKLWEEFVRKTKGEFDYLEGAANKTYGNIIKDWNLSRDDVVNGISGNFAKRAKELSYVREMLVRDAAKQQKGAAANQNTPLTPAPDLSGLNPLKDSEAATSVAKNSVATRLKAAQEATRDYKAEVAALMQQLASGKITLQQYNAALEHQARKLQETTDPYTSMVRAMQEENSLLGMSKDAQEQERAVRDAKTTVTVVGKIVDLLALKFAPSDLREGADHTSDDLARQIEALKR